GGEHALHDRTRPAEVWREAADTDRRPYEHQQIGARADETDRQSARGQAEGAERRVRETGRGDKLRLREPVRRRARRQHDEGRCTSRCRRECSHCDRDGEETIVTQPPSNPTVAMIHTFARLVVSSAFALALFAPLAARSTLRGAETDSPKRKILFFT